MLKAAVSILCWHQIHTVSRHRHGCKILNSDTPVACAASLDDMYSIKSDGSLHVRSVLRVGNKVEDTLQVYRSADTWKPQNEWSNGAALGVGNIFRNPFSRWSQKFCRLDVGVICALIGFKCERRREILKEAQDFISSLPGIYLLHQSLYPCTYNNQDHYHNHNLVYFCICL